MNKDTAKDYLPLVQALADGKAIQRVRSNGTSYATEWVDIQNYEQINMRLPASCYRVKPEPSQDNIEIAMALEDMAKKIRSMKVHCFDFETKSVQAGTGLVCYSTFTWQHIKSD